MTLDFLCNRACSTGGRTFIDTLAPPSITLGHYALRLCIANPNPTGVSRILCNINEEGWRVWHGEEEVPRETPVRSVAALAQAYEAGGYSDSELVSYRSQGTKMSAGSSDWLEATRP
jgi:hypothetical protein